MHPINNHPNISESSQVNSTTSSQSSTSESSAPAVQAASQGVLRRPLLAAPSNVVNPPSSTSQQPSSFTTNFVAQPSSSSFQATSSTARRLVPPPTPMSKRTKPASQSTSSRSQVDSISDFVAQSSSSSSTARRLVPPPTPMSKRTKPATQSTSSCSQGDSISDFVTQSSSSSSTARRLVPPPTPMSKRTKPATQSTSSHSRVGSIARQNLQFSSTSEASMKRKADDEFSVTGRNSSPLEEEGFCQTFDGSFTFDLSSPPQSKRAKKALNFGGPTRTSSSSSTARPRERMTPSSDVYEKTKQINKKMEAYLHSNGSTEFPIPTVTPDGNQNQASIGDWLGSGQFMSVHDLTWNGEQQVLKYFHFNETGPLRKDGTEGAFKNHLRDEFFNYYCLKQINGFPIASYHNFDFLLANEEVVSHLTEWRENLPAFSENEDTFDLDTKSPKKKTMRVLEENFEGFYRSDKMTRPFLTREQLDQINRAMEEGQEISEENKELISQLKNMFKLLWDHKTVADLKRDNIGIDENGRVTLYDLLGDVEEDELNPFYCLVDQKLADFATKDSALWKYLDPSPKEKTESN